MKTGNWELNYQGILNICVNMGKWESKPSVEQLIKVAPSMPVIDAEALIDGLVVVPEGYEGLRFMLEEVFDEVDV